MKLHYSKILFFSLPLNILEHNNNKPYITPHTSTTTSRMLRECDLYMPKYDNDADMKSVKENFDRRTSQRFEEYDERMNEKRQKSKEQRDKNVQKIIEKDKIEKSLTEKVEKGCLRCGCGLGGVAAGVGIIGPIAVGAWKPTALKVAIAKAITEGTAKIAKASEAARILAGKNALIKGLDLLNIGDLKIGSWELLINQGDYTDVNEIVKIIKLKKTQMCGLNKTLGDTRCQEISTKLGLNSLNSERAPPDITAIEQTVTKIVEETKGPAKAAAEAAEAAEKLAIETTQKGIIDASSYNWYATIGYSVMAILIIVLIMLIIYLILRYRRKKKMNKKLQYTKLLNQ
ncbi:surface antigen [Plasmodium falciparum UGT5.1]|uniref:Surface antigen n=1 Tax=Plasmodium falciparum UGT5.1 TaxID=1237627 RepID=W7K3T4_PLAFA|nr:surface antigen [Plasmodium falciparum UGT5.1]